MRINSFDFAFWLLVAEMRLDEAAKMIAEKGGAGSGFPGHEGRPGEGVGGSKPMGEMESTRSEGGKIIPTGGGDLSEHIASLRIPPAWTDVRYNSDPKADMLVKAKDAKGRDVYIYSQRFKDSQAEVKFARIKELDQKFDVVISENMKNLKSNDPDIREHAAVMSVIMETGIRPGSNKDTQAEKKAYGATTLLGKHVVVEGNKVSLQYTGKKGVDLNIPIDDAKVRDMLIDRKKTSGGDGKLFNVNEKTLLSYSNKFDGGGFKTKDFRTLVANKTAMNAMRGMSTPKTEKEYKKAAKEVATVVSAKLGNTPVVALQSYINPEIFSAWRSKL